MLLSAQLSKESSALATKLLLYFTHFDNDMHTCDMICFTSDLQANQESLQITGKHCVHFVSPDGEKVCWYNGKPTRASKGPPMQPHVLR